MARVQPSSKKPPVSFHPLFPAVVSLWFAALFGMGSFVLPNILIERAIVLAGIDAILPSAAPPLGVTARIAVSLGAAFAGAVLGFIIARKVARAQAAHRPARTGRRPYQADDFDRQQVRRPISAHDELGLTRLDPRPAAEHGPAGRRRPLAMQEDDRPSTFLQAAPLPGSRHEDAQPEFASPAAPEPLDLGHFEQPTHPQPQAEPGYGDQIAELRNAAPSEPQRPETIAPAADWAQPPVPDFNRPDFGPAAAPAAAEFAPPADPQAPQFARPEALPLAGFDRPEPPAPLPFARPTVAPDGDPLAPFRAPEPVAEAEPDEDEDDGFPFGVGALQAAAPVREPQPEVAPLAAVPLPFAAPQPEEPVPVTAEDGPLEFFAPSQASADAEPEPEPEADEPLELAEQAEAATPAPRESLDGLSMVDLAERLARSLGRHGSAITPPAGLAAALAAPLAPRPAAPVAEAVPEPFEPPQEAVAEAVEDEIAELPPAFAAPVGQFVPPPPVIPEALRPLPLEIDDFGEEEDEDDFEQSLTFGRAIPERKTPPPGAQVFQADPPALPDDFSDEADAEDDDALVEIDGYSSLLAMKSPFRVPAENVRIEQPEPADAPAEPAVIFPGREATGTIAATASASPPAPAAAPSAAPTAAPTAAQVRRFDAPGNLASIVAPPPSRPRVDRDEAERALRSALSTLQRMSGAA